MKYEPVKYLPADHRNVEACSAVRPRCCTPKTFPTIPDTIPIMAKQKGMAESNIADRQMSIVSPPRNQKGLVDPAVERMLPSPLPFSRRERGPLKSLHLFSSVLACGPAASRSSMATWAGCDCRTIRHWEGGSK